MQVDQPLSRQRPQPHKQRNLGIGHIFVQAPGRVHERLLQDVRNIDASVQTVIHPQTDGTTEPLAKLLEQVSQRLLIPRGCELDQIVWFRLMVHGGAAIDAWLQRGAIRFETTEVVQFSCLRTRRQVFRAAKVRELSKLGEWRKEIRVLAHAPSGTISRGRLTNLFEDPRSDYMKKDSISAKPSWRNDRPRSRRRRLLLEALESRHMLAADFLYIGDAGTDSVQKFDAETGALIGAFVPSGGASLHGPRGMVFHDDKLLLVNQNVDPTDGSPSRNGEVLRFDSQTGAALAPLVASLSSDAPFAPRGIVVRNNVAYVADFEGSIHPRIAKYNATTGVFLGELVASGFGGEFRPRGLVFGPEGGLYVSVFSESSFSSGDPAGFILRFDTKTGEFRVVARNDGDGVPETGEIDLHNPEGLVFGPSGSLYVTSNRTEQTTLIDENTSILVIDPATGRQLDRIALTPTARPDNPTRIFAQAILFGPGDKLFIPVTETSLSDGLATGGVWTYDPASGKTSAFVVPSLFDPPLTFPDYLTFGQTDAATLHYVVSATGEPPVLSNLETTPVSIEGSVTAGEPLNTSTVPITATLQISDSDSATIKSATVSIVRNYRLGHDRLLFDNTAKISGVWNQTTGKLTLSGSDTLANYQAVLRNVRFQTSGFHDPVSDTRTIQFRVDDGEHTSNRMTRVVRVALLRGDYLFIADQGDLNDPNDDTVKQVDVNVPAGPLVSTFVAPGQLHGPRGLVFNAGNLLTVNQNVDMLPNESSLSGEVLRFDGKSGLPLAPVVEADDSQAPFAPRGIVVKDGVLYVADFEGMGSPRVAKYDATSGAFIGDLVPKGFAAEFRPRGLVFGPDGKLYVSVFSEETFTSNDPAGYVLRFLDTNSGAFRRGRSKQWRRDSANR